MTQHPMPVMTEQQREQMVADCELYLSDPSCYQDWFIVMTKVTLAVLTAEPHAWHRMPDQGFHLPMVLRKEQGPPALEGEFYPVYDVPPLPNTKPVELPKPHREDYVGSKVMYADDVEAAILDAGYEVKK